MSDPMFDPTSSSQKPRWYLARAGERHGPIGDAKLFSLAAEDLIAPSDLVWRPGFLAWISAGEIPGLLIPPPLPGSAGGRAGSGADPAPAARLTVVNETDSAVAGLTTNAAAPHDHGPHDQGDDDVATRSSGAAAEAPIAQEQAASNVTTAAVGWGGNKNLEALRDALRSAPNYAP